MLTLETVNELTLKVTCSGSGVLIAKAGSARRTILPRLRLVPWSGA